ncbi:MAG: hypothetical protein D6B26_07305 [Spirochaetaceae bacterium]|nr:MAG: hypothetical protein D6B26_07305 [Spirochaetaceae bacterium]
MERDELVENTSVRQREDEGFRRWFVNSFFEVILWYKANKADLIGFQFCYSRKNNEKAFTWTSEYASNRLVSDTFYETGMSHMSTGVLKGEGGAIPEDIIKRFDMESGILGEEIKTLIIEKIKDYNNKLARK